MNTSPESPSHKRKVLIRHWSRKELPRIWRAAVKCLVVTIGNSATDDVTKDPLFYTRKRLRRYQELLLLHEPPSAEQIQGVAEVLINLEDALLALKEGNGATVCETRMRNRRLADRVLNLMNIPSIYCAKPGECFCSTHYI